MDEEQWLLWLHLHGVRLPVPEPRKAGDPTFRKVAVCLICPWTGSAHHALEHRDITRHPVVWPTPER